MEQHEGQVLNLTAQHLGKLTIDGEVVVLLIDTYDDGSHWLSWRRLDEGWSTPVEARPLNIAEVTA